MVCSAAPVLLLAMTLPLGQGQTGGESGQQLDQESGAGESVPVSVYVQLYFSITLTGLSLTAECSVTRKGCSYCACLSGYQWNASVCSHHRPCQTPLKHRPCGCLVFGPAEAGYCQLLPPVPAALSLNSWLQTPGDTLNLTRLTSQETTNLNWFLWPTGSPSPILLQAGTRVSLTSSRDRAVLSIVNISHKWAREYVCCFEARGFRWELHQMVRVPLQVTDVAGLPDQLSVSCATSPGFQLSCCIPSAHLSYTASWSPRDGNEASLFNTPDSQCFVLAVQRCPAADTTYTCDLQSPGLSPLRAAVSVTVIQDGDTTCPEDSSAVAWNVTKAGHVAQAPCPGKRRGMVKRPCRPEGVWGPIHSSCTDTGLLALLLRAWLLRAGPGWPVDEVSQILAQLPEQAVVVTSPTDLLALVGTMTILAKVVADARIQLNSSALEPPLQAQIPRHSLAPLGHNGTNVSVTSLVLRKLDHLLPSNYGQGLGDSIYATPGLVLAISITAGGQVFNQGEVIMDFGDTDGSPHCVFWDHDPFQGKGGWSEAGCQVQAASASPTTQCICRHLTAFSILMSGHTVPKNPTLEMLSQVGLGASILALLVCLGVYRLVWRFVVRNKVAYLRHTALLNMVLCLLAADTCFLGAPLLPPGPHSPLCLAAAFLCHFLYLATFFWMLAQALMLAHQLLFVFHQLSKHRGFSLMVFLGYLYPMGFAGVALGLYLPRGQYLGEGACWLDKKGGALYTFVGPVLAIVGVNGLVLTVAVLKLLRPSLSEGPQVEKHQALLGVIKALLVLTPIFGLIWGLGLATLLEEVSIVPHYVFTVLNTSQGVFILLFGCLMDRKVQEALRKHFCRTQPPSSLKAEGSVTTTNP
ncbi:hypothetical protein J1605_018037 [Eschrichtius robustus]|uniref:Adhesion G-protein coupled receptor F3 n=1 Tax=Eschrichtius robustus TaxID=9764 RepID=A0AB34HYL0_ESCRO|nr:hypothetical protein J1605_018037 [Eschrichtius robustus]